MAGDPYFSNVKLLCGFDSTIVDESSFPHTLTAVGNAAVDTAVTKYGAGSVVMDGSGDRITIPTSSDWSFGSSDFTVEGFFNFSSTSNNQAMLGVWSDTGVGSGDSWYLYLNSGFLTFRYYSSVTHDVLVAWTPSVGTWYHIAAVRSGNNWYLWIDGALLASVTSSNVIQTSSSNLVIGAIGNTGAFAGYDFAGHMDEIRITKGVARYTSPFTPPTSAFPRTNSVVLLCHFDEGAGSTSFVDVSPSAHTLTSLSGAVQNAPGKFGATSLDVSFSAGSMVQSADSTDWAFGAGQFTIEAWVRPTTAFNSTDLRGIVNQWAGLGTLAWWFGWYLGGLTFFYSSDGSNSSSVGATYSPSLNDWVHVAVDRDATNTIRVYGNGVVLASGVVATSFFDSANALCIGSTSNANRWLGQIDEIRITNGLAQYGGAFTPPTQPFADGLNPNLLSTGFVRETVGNSTGTLKFTGLARETVGSAISNLNASAIVREVVVLPTSYVLDILAATDILSASNNSTVSVSVTETATISDSTDAATQGLAVIGSSATVDAFLLDATLAALLEVSSITTVDDFAQSVAVDIESSFAASQTINPFEQNVIVQTLLSVSSFTTFDAFTQDAELIAQPYVVIPLGGVEAVASVEATTVNEIAVSVELQGQAVIATSATARDEETSSEQLVGLQVNADIGSLVAAYPDARTFWIAGNRESIIPAGVVLLPTSDDLSVVAGQYIFGSSQFYTIGEVYWDGEQRVQGVDWEFVQPFTHIIRILVTDTSIGTVRVIYYKWDIQVRAGFQVTSYPVRFTFNRTSIIAERVPPANQYFTVLYTEPRPGPNPVTLFARFPVVVDEILDVHTLYDGTTGFETYRPIGYRVFDTSDRLLYTWNGETWDSSHLSASTTFYVKRDRAIYLFNGSTVTPVYTAGDVIDGSLVETLTYPRFGEGVGFNLLEDAFAPGAASLYPAAYQIGQHPGKYDDWGSV